MSVLAFRLAARRAVFISIIAVALNTFYPTIPISIFANIGCLTYLYWTSESLAVSKSEGFDPIVASETMVAFGVFSLVSGLSSILLALILGRIGSVSGPNGLLVFLPFVEGLATAGLAPIFAMLLRIRVAELETEIDPTGDMAGLASATADLTSAVKAANVAVETFQKSTTSAGTAATGLASSMKSEADKWGLALQEGQAHVKTFGEATRISSGEVSQLASATENLRRVSSEVSTLMEELSRLIAAVERFVEPRSKKT